jgi:NAD+-dependent secondary alcohol dehydrogenase Adh1
LGSNYGTLNDLEDVITLAREGKVSLNVRTYPLEEVNEALSALDRGEVVDTRLVVVPY